MASNTSKLVSLITGGASGFGKATAARLSGIGQRVVIADVPSSKGAQVAKDHNADFVPVDVTNAKDVTEAVDFIRDKYTQLNVVMNCAGINHALPVYDFKTDTPHDLDTLKQIINVNLIGTFNVCRLVAGLMSKSPPIDADGQRGVIINIASVAPLDGYPGIAYNASKGGVAGMTLSMAREFGPAGIRVVAICPVAARTPMVEGLGPWMPEFVRSVTEAMAFPKRLLEAEEVARLVEFIVQNPMINGGNIRIDAGFRTAFRS